MEWFSLQSKYSKEIIDKLEYYITKEIEGSNYYGYSDVSSSSLYDWAVVCIKARKELKYKPFYTSVEEFLGQWGYDKNHIDKFIQNAVYGKPIEFPYYYDKINERDKI